MDPVSQVTSMGSDGAMGVPVEDLPVPQVPIRTVVHLNVGGMLIAANAAVALQRESATPS